MECIYEDLGESWPRYNGIVLYTLSLSHWLPLLLLIIAYTAVVVTTSISTATSTLPSCYN